MRRRLLGVFNALLLKTTFASNGVTDQFIKKSNDDDHFKISVKVPVINNDVFTFNYLKRTGTIGYECPKFKDPNCKGWTCRFKPAEEKPECVAALDRKEYSNPLIVKKIGFNPMNRAANLTVKIPGLAPLDMILGKDGFNLNFDGEFKADDSPPFLPLNIDFMTSLSRTMWRNKFRINMDSEQGFSLGGSTVGVFTSKTTTLSEKITEVFKILSKFGLDIFHQHAAYRSLTGEQNENRTEKARFSYLHKLNGKRKFCGNTRNVDFGKSGCKVQLAVRRWTDDNVKNQWKDNEFCDKEDRKDDPLLKTCHEHVFFDGTTLIYKKVNETYRIQVLSRTAKSQKNIMLLNLAVKDQGDYYTFYTVNKNNGSRVLDIPKKASVDSFKKHVETQFSWFSKMTDSFFLPLHLDVISEEMTAADFDLRPAFKKLHFTIHGDYLQKFMNFMFKVDIQKGFYELVGELLQGISIGVNIGLKHSLIAPEIKCESDPESSCSLEYPERPEFVLPRVSESLVGKNLTLSNISRNTRVYLENLKGEMAEIETKAWLDGVFDKAFKKE